MLRLRQRICTISLLHSIGQKCHDVSSGLRGGEIVSLHLLMGDAAKSQFKEYEFREDGKSVANFVIYHSLLFDHNYSHSSHRKNMLTTIPRPPNTSCNYVIRLEDQDLVVHIRFYDKVLSLHEDSTTPVANPLLAFTLIKRLQSDWRNVVHSLEASENIRALKDGYEKVEQDLPAFEDLEGAARALMRLQDVYMLNVKGLARGVFQRVTGSAITDLYSPKRLFSLTGDDCFQVGKVAYDMGDYYHAIPWLEEAVSLFRGSYGEWKTEDEASLEDALDHLAFAYFRAGNVSCALSLSREFLLYSPDNKRMARNVLKYERLLAESPNHVVAEAVIQRPNIPHLQTRDTYEGLCQTLGSQPTLYQIPSLYCSYETNSNAYLLLQPIRKEVIHLEPYIALYHDFVSDSEAQKIRELAEPWLQRSVVASGEKQLQVEYRISKSHQAAPSTE
nr:prolyl 4-hydroxylase subunit alpha-3 isoform X6 [Pan troglodytes]